MRRRESGLGILLAVLFAHVPWMEGHAAESPNFVILLADDLGYGDVAALNPEGKIATPQLDRLAREGMTFTDAHSASSVCTPSRYALLTGRYAWRTRLESGVLYGYSPRLIEPNRQTIASWLIRAGYDTACFGKWHLGLGWRRADGSQAEGEADAWKVDYTLPFSNGPDAVGFRHFFGISASLDMPPFLYLRGDRATEIPTVEKEWIRRGPSSPEFEAVDVLPEIVSEAQAYLQERVRDQKPFCLYVAFPSPHTPIVPTPEWQGKSGLNDYADFVQQTDAAVGSILDTLEMGGLTEKTIVCFTSDNGCSPMADFEFLKARGHNPSGPFRGHKADIYEGGHRVPFFIRWPGVVAPGSHSEQTICHTDLFATFAAILQTPLEPNEAEDSWSLLPTLRGDPGGHRPPVVHHSIDGSFAIRDGDWKLCFCPGSGGWSFPRPGRDATKGQPLLQLFDMKSDMSERFNLSPKHSERVQRMSRHLQMIVEQGRSTQGPRQENDRQVDVWKAGRAAHAQTGKPKSP